jgi:hypothetical protein
MARNNGTVYRNLSRRVEAGICHFARVREKRCYRQTQHLAGGVKLALILIGNNVVNQSGLTPLNCSCQPIGLTFYINNDSLTDHTTCSCQPIGIDVLSCWLDRRVT